MAQPNAEFPFFFFFPPHYHEHDFDPDDTDGEGSLLQKIVRPVMTSSDERVAHYSP